MSAGQMWALAAGALAIAALLGALLGTRARRHLAIRRLRRLPRARLGQLREGAATVSGRARLDGEPLRSPVTSQPCIAYRLRALSRTVQEGREHRSAIVEREEGGSFWLVDGEARARVELPAPTRTPTNPLHPTAVTTMPGVHLVLGPPRTLRSEDIGQHEEQRILAWLGVPQDASYTSRGHTYEVLWAFEESCLVDGDPVVVAGRLAPGAASGYRAQGSDPVVRETDGGLLIDRTG